MRCRFRTRRGGPWMGPITVGEFTPVGAELEGHDDAGNNSHSERNGKYLEPKVEQHPVHGAAGGLGQHLKRRQPSGKPDGERRKNDMKGNGEAELNARERREGLGPCVFLWQAGSDRRRQVAPPVVDLNHHEQPQLPASAACFAHPHKPMIRHGFDKEQALAADGDVSFASCGSGCQTATAFWP